MDHKARSARQGIASDSTSKIYRHRRKWNHLFCAVKMSKDLKLTREKRSHIHRQCERMFCEDVGLNVTSLIGGRHDLCECRIGAMVDIRYQLVPRR